MTTILKLSVPAILAVALSACVPAPPPAPKVAAAGGDEPLSRSQLITLETYLKQLGYLSSTPDGRIGPDTRLAIVQYQEAAGLPPNGYYSNALVSSLGRSIDTKTATTTRKTTTARRTTSRTTTTTGASARKTATNTATKTPTTSTTPVATKPATTTAATTRQAAPPPPTAVDGGGDGGGGGGGDGGGGGW